MKYPQGACPRSHAGEVRLGPGHSAPHGDIGRLPLKPGPLTPPPNGDLAVTDVEVRGVVILSAEEREWVRRNGVHVLWSGGSWHAAQGEKVLTVGSRTPQRAIKLAMEQQP